MIKKYYVWKDGDHADVDGFFDYNDAYEWCMEINGDEIELARWEDNEIYESGGPAIEFKTVWKR